MTNSCDASVKIENAITILKISRKMHELMKIMKLYKMFKLWLLQLIKIVSNLSRSLSGTFFYKKSFVFLKDSFLF